jgi:hypothetical protein
MFYLSILKINLKKLKTNTLIYFQVKITLKNNRGHISISKRIHNLSGMAFKISSINRIFLKNNYFNGRGILIPFLRIEMEALSSNSKH